MMKYICKSLKDKNDLKKEDFKKIIFKGFLRNFGGIYYQNEKDNILSNILRLEFQDIL